MATILEGCPNHAAPAHEALSLDAAAHHYVRLTVALGEHDPDSLDYYTGAPDAVADLRKSAPSAGQIQREAVDLRHALESMPLRGDQVKRRSYLGRQLEAIACRAGYMAGQRSRFTDEVKCSFDIDLPSEANSRELAAVRERLNHLLPGSGTLGSRYVAFAARYAVPTTKLRETMERAIAGCREVTARHLSIPSDESIELELSGDKPWAGFSRYQGNHHSKVSINADYPVTVDRALDLACHETYPGHHLYNMTAEDKLAQAAHREEFTVQPTYSPQSFLSEGAATLAVEVAFPRQERMQFEKGVLCPVAGLKCAEMEKFLEVEWLMQQMAAAVPAITRPYLDGEMEFVRTGEVLEKQVLMDHYFDLLKYLNEFRSYVVTYTLAPGRLRKQLPAGDSKQEEERRWKIYAGWAEAKPDAYPWVQ